MDKEEILWAIDDIKCEKKQLTQQVSELNLILKELTSVLKEKNE